MRLGQTLGAVVIAASVGLCGTSAFAKDAAKQPPSNPVGAGWGKTTVTTNTKAGTFTPEQVSAINAISKYFNDLTTVDGRFVQTDPDGSTTQGKFFVKKPGMFRFEYAKPSRKVVISDGRFLAIENHDTGEEQTYELSDTPFRMLLKQEVNLMRDAQILQVDDSAEQVSIVVRDKDPDIGAAIKVVMTKGENGAMVLRGWITRDAQGLETKVEVTNVTHGTKLADAKFKRGKLFLKKIQN